MSSFMRDFSKRLQAYKRARLKLQASANDGVPRPLTRLEAEVTLNHMDSLARECESLKDSISWDD